MASASEGTSLEKGPLPAPSHVEGVPSKQQGEAASFPRAPPRQGTGLVSLFSSESLPWQDAEARCRGLAPPGLKRLPLSRGGGGGGGGDLSVVKRSGCGLC